MASQKRIIAALMQRHGRTFASELGIDLRKNRPSQLFRRRCYSLLTSAPISAELAMRGTRAMAKAGWTTPQKLQASDWETRARVLNESGYARVDEKTATQLADMNAALTSSTRRSSNRRKESRTGSINRCRAASGRCLRRGNKRRGQAGRRISEHPCSQCPSEKAVYLYAPRQRHVRWRGTLAWNVLFGREIFPNPSLSLVYVNRQTICKCCSER